MEKLTYDQFYSHVWEDSTWLAHIVSTAYLEKYDDFIRSLTYDVYMVYEKSDIPLQLMVKQFEIFFFNLFRFESGCDNIEEIQDGYSHF